MMTGVAEDAGPGVAEVDSGRLEVEIAFDAAGEFDQRIPEITRTY